MEKLKTDSSEEEIEIRRVHEKNRDKIIEMTDSHNSRFLSSTSTYKQIPNLEINSNIKKIEKSYELLSLTSNDRDIPDFLEKEREKESYLKLNYLNSSSKSTQTQLTCVNGSSCILLTSELNKPTTPLSSMKKLETGIKYNQELTMTRTKLSNIHNKYEQLKLRFHRLHTDYYKLMSITGELTSALSNSINQQPVSIEKTLRNCMKIYPDLFNKNVHDDDSQLSLKFEDNNDNFGKKTMLSTVPLSAKSLNYKKIKLHLINGTVKTKLLLLQALRWKITLSQPDERDDVINEYINSDLIGLYGQIAGDNGKTVLPYLLVPIDDVQPNPIQQSAARLLNTFASLKCGRDYLSVGPTVLNVVVQCLDSTHADSIDAFTCDMIIAMLQKLSLRRHQRLYMIAAGLVEWLIHHLKAECHSMGTYRLEYATALLMNLSLHKEAQIRVSAMATMVISTLIALLSTDHLPALPYINGALNSFLANSSINEEARLIGLGPILEYHRKHRTGELRNHLEYILMRHRRQPNETIEEGMNDDDDREEFDVLEDELDEMDPVKINPGDLFGETLLSTCYSLPPDLHQVENIINSNSPTIVYQTQESIAEKSKEHDRRESSINAMNSLMSTISPDNLTQVEDGIDNILSHIKIVNEKVENESQKEDEEQAFAAKPKITRTPPETPQKSSKSKSSHKSSE